MHAEAGPLDAFAVTAPGVEPITDAELRALGVDGQVEQGGIAFRAELPDICRANLELRTAARVIVRLGHFRARALGEITRRSVALPWERYLEKGQAVQFRVTSKKSRLYHTTAITERLARGVAERLGGSVDHETSGSDDEEQGERQLIVVRVAHDECTVSVDSSGALLHARGYRQASGRAPIRENLAAALLLAAGYDGSVPLLDPMCGSGTLPIEGALIARDIAPGSRRGFAFERWPELDRSIWHSVRAASRARVCDHVPASIVGSDRDTGAVDAAFANATRAGVAQDIRLHVASLSAAEPTADAPGLLVSNPPYGVRMGEERALRDLYARLGQVVRERFSAWRVAMISSSDRLAAATELEWRELFRTRTGGLPISILLRDPRSGHQRGVKSGRPRRRSM